MDLIFKSCSLYTSLGKALFKVLYFVLFLSSLYTTKEQSSLLLIFILYALRLYSFPQLNIWVAANKVLYTELVLFQKGFLFSRGLCTEIKDLKLK